MGVAGKVPQSGRTKDELKTAAHFVDVKKSIAAYRRSSSPDMMFSYSLETNRYYNVNNDVERTTLLEQYSDGHSKLYIIALTHERSPIKDERAVLVSTWCVNTGKIPFIGSWNDRGDIYEDVSFSIDHGVSLVHIQSLLRRHRQKAALLITRGGHTLIYNQHTQRHRRRRAKGITS